MRPSGNRTPPWYPLLVGPVVTFPYTGVGDVAHHDLVGWDEALHVAEIQAWIVTAFEGVGKRYGPLLNKSSL